MPQAIGLWLGEWLGFIIDTLYQLTRFMVLGTITLLLFAGFKIYYVSPLAVALLIVSMSVFQLSSASLDGVSTALALFLIVSTFRISDEKKVTSPWLSYWHSANYDWHRNGGKSLVKK